MSRSVYIRRVRRRDPRLGRIVAHDPKSWAFPYPTAGLPIAAVRWLRAVPVFDQGQVGSCTGNAGIGALCTGPLWPIVPSTRYTPDEKGAVALYSDAEDLDGDGPYPPNDNGSSGLSIAKALVRGRMIPGYRHVFSLDDVLRALTQTPLITGINWYQDMFHPDGEGIVRTGGSLAGGHEIVVDEHDPDRGLVGFTNSWGPSWGAAGRFYLPVAEYGQLLDDAGDVTVLLPVAPPAPPPVPDDRADRADRDLAAAFYTGGWVTARHTGGNRRVAEAAKVWLRAKSR